MEPDGKGLGQNDKGEVRMEVLGVEVGRKNESESLRLVLGQSVTGAWRILQSSASLEASRPALGSWEGGGRKRNLDPGQLDPRKILWELQSGPSGTHFAPSAPDPERLDGASSEEIGASSSRAQCKWSCNGSYTQGTEERVGAGFF